MGFTVKDARRIAYAFIFAFVSSLVVNAAGVAQAKNYNEGKAAVISLIVAAIAAGLSAVKNFFLAENSPLK